MKKYKLKFKWTDEFIQTNVIVIEANSKQRAKVKLEELLDGGGYQYIGKEIDREYLNLGNDDSYPYIISTEESKISKKNMKGRYKT